MSKIISNVKSITQSGDTIVEVMLAMALLTSVLFTSWSATNRAGQISLASRQRIIMVNQLKEQAEILKAKQFSEAGGYFASLPQIAAAIPAPNPCEDVESAPAVLSNTPAGAFYYAKTQNFLTGATITLANGVKQADATNTSKVWVQRKSGSSTGGGFNDFYVRACWITPGGVQKLDNSQLLVRINL